MSKEVVVTIAGAVIRSSAAGIAANKHLPSLLRDCEGRGPVQFGVTGTLKKGSAKLSDVTVVISMHGTRCFSNTALV